MIRLFNKYIKKLLISQNAVAHFYSAGILSALSAFLNLRSPRMNYFYLSWKIVKALNYEVSNTLFLL